MLPERLSNDMCSLREDVDRPEAARAVVIDKTLLRDDSRGLHRHLPAPHSPELAERSDEGSPVTCRLSPVPTWHSQPITSQKHCYRVVYIVREGMKPYLFGNHKFAVGVVESFCIFLWTATFFNTEMKR